MSPKTSLLPEHTTGSHPETGGSPVDPVKFHQAKFRKDRDQVLHSPMQGFGGGNFTLYLPSPRPKIGYVFRDGVPRREISQSVIGNAELTALRDRVIRSMRLAGPGLLSIDLEFLSYAAALIKLSYSVSDEDLTFLLQGEQWKRGMIAHLMGGEGVITALAEAAPRLLPAQVPLPPPAPAPARLAPLDEGRSPRLDPPARSTGVLGAFKNWLPVMRGRWTI